MQHYENFLEIAFLKVHLFNVLKFMLLWPVYLIYTQNKSEL